MSRWRQALSTRPSRKAKLPPPCAKHSERGRDALERAGQDQRQDAELRFRRHRHQPRQHPLFHAWRAHHVPRVHQYGNAFVGAVDEEGDQAFVVEVAVAEVVADLHADMASSLGARGFAAGRVDILQRHLGQRLEPRGAVRAEFQRVVVHALRPGHRDVCRIAVAEHHGRGAHELDVDAAAVHFLDAARGVPQRGVDRAEWLVAGHDHGRVRAIGLQPGRGDGVKRRGLLAGDGREEVAVDIHYAVGAHSGSLLAGAEARPGCTVPHCPQRRSAALS